MTTNIIGRKTLSGKKSVPFLRWTEQDFKTIQKKRLSQQETLVFIGWRFCEWRGGKAEQVAKTCNLPLELTDRLLKQLKKRKIIESSRARVRTIVHDHARTIVHDPAHASAGLVFNSDIIKDPFVRPFVGSTSHEHARTHEGKISIEVRTHYRQLFPEVTASKIAKILEAGALACEQEIGSAPTHDEWIAFGTWAKNAACLAKATYRLGASMAHLAGRVARMRSVNKTSGNHNATRSGSLLPTLAQSERAAELIRLLASR